MEDQFSEGMRLFKEKNYLMAENSFRDLINSDHTNHKAWNALGVTFSKNGKYDFADEAFEQALILDPGNITYEKNQNRNQSKIVSPQSDSLMIDCLNTIKCNKNQRLKRNYFQILRKCVYLIVISFVLLVLGSAVLAYNSVFPSDMTSNLNKSVEAKVTTEMANLALFTLKDRDKLVNTDIRLNDQKVSNFFDFSSSSEKDSTQVIGNSLNIKIVGYYTDGSVRDAFNWTI